MTTRHAPNYFRPNKLNKLGPERWRRKSRNSVSKGLDFASVNSISLIPVYSYRFCSKECVRAFPLKHSAKSPTHLIILVCLGPEFLFLIVSERLTFHADPAFLLTRVNHAEKHFIGTSATLGEDQSSWLTLRVAAEHLLSFRKVVTFIGEPGLHHAEHRGASSLIWCILSFGRIRSYRLKMLYTILCLKLVNISINRAFITKHSLCERYS
jgi:hypothetical protein